MTGSPALDTPRRSLAELRDALITERAINALAQLEAEVSGCATVAAHHAREIARIDVRLREIEGATER